MAQPRDMPDATRRASARAGGPDAARSDLAAFERTEDGIALAFTARHNGDLRFCHHAGKWYVWTGTRWQKEETKLAFNWARKICRDSTRRRTRRSPRPARRLRWSGSRRRIGHSLSPRRSGTPIRFCWARPAGVVDLRTGILRPASGRTYITKQTAVAPDPRPSGRSGTAFSTKRHAWRRRASAVPAAGRAATASPAMTREHALFFVYGPGGNGKSVFLNILDRHPGRLRHDGGDGHLHRLDQRPAPDRPRHAPAAPGW